MKNLLPKRIIFSMLNYLIEKKENMSTIRQFNFYTLNACSMLKIVFLLCPHRHGIKMFYVCIFFCKLTFLFAWFKIPCENRNFFINESIFPRPSLMWAVDGWTDRAMWRRITAVRWPPRRQITAGISSALFTVRPGVEMVGGEKRTRPLVFTNRRLHWAVEK